MSYHIPHNDYCERTLDTIRSIKTNARWEMGRIDSSLGEIPEWNENPEAYAAYEAIAKAARELEKAYIAFLAVYERQELNPGEWLYASSRRSAKKSA